MPRLRDTRTGADFSNLPPVGSPREAAGILARLAKDPAFLDAHVLPLLESARHAEEWYVAGRQEIPGGCSLQVFVWPAGTGTKVHDHSSWGVLCSAFGSVFEERYERLDDGSQFEYARLEKAWQRMWGEEDGVSTVLSRNGGIHRLGNPGDGVAISVHIYGPRVGAIDGRDYDPSRDYVCDRRD